MDTSNILYIDTESNPTTKKPECVQWLFRGKTGIFEDFSFDEYEKLKEMWVSADAVMMFNAPYDMGVLSCSYRWNACNWLEKDLSSFWKMLLFGNIYNVRKISFHRNLIKPLNMEKTKYKKAKGTRSTPVIDLLKLWSILIEDTDISLKSLIKRHLKKEPIKWNEEVSRTEAYRLQDVVCLEELTKLFFHKISNIEGLSNYDLERWGFIKTPATFTKLAYADEYPDLKQYSKFIDGKINEVPEMEEALENAFHGGITLSFYRGTLTNTGWVDISGAYTKAQDVINTDSYMKFDYINHVGSNWNYDKHNCLLKVKSNFILTTINKSLKLFAVEIPTINWVWAFDLRSCKNLYPDYEYEVLEGYEYIPLLNISETLTSKWGRAKDIEKATNGKTTLYDFCKFRSNTGYGIKAQRKPFKTINTNMVIAGMITSYVHYILTSIIDELEKHNLKNLYNDTDSCCFHHPSCFGYYCMQSLINDINVRIYPFTVESEGYQKETTFLSLKRYISEGGTDKNKIKLHGKGRYKISKEEIYTYVKTQKVYNEMLVVGQLAANTMRGMNQILKIYPFLEENKHPFMFCKDVKSTNKTKAQFFNDWYYHIDTKTTFSEEKEFFREFHLFYTVTDARKWFSNYVGVEDIEQGNIRHWDNEIKEDFI